MADVEKAITSISMTQEKCLQTFFYTFHIQCLFRLHSYIYMTQIHYVDNIVWVTGRVSVLFCCSIKGGGLFWCANAETYSMLAQCVTPVEQKVVHLTWRVSVCMAWWPKFTSVLVWGCRGRREIEGLVQYWLYWPATPVHPLVWLVNGQPQYGPACCLV